MSEQTDEKRAEYIQLLANIILQCNEDPLLSDISMGDLSRTVRSIQKISDSAYTEVIELIGRVCDRVTLPEATEDCEDDAVTDAIGRIIFDLMWKATFKEGRT